MSKTIWIIVVAFLALAGVEFGLVGARAAGVGLRSGAGATQAAGTPAAIALTASPAEILCDGTQTSTVTAKVTDATGAAVPDDTLVNFAVVALGTANPINATTTNGGASSTITPISGVNLGLTVIVTSGAAQSSIRVDCAPNSCWPQSPPIVSTPSSPPSLSPPSAPVCPTPEPTCRTVGPDAQGRPASPPGGPRPSPPLPPCPSSQDGCGTPGNRLSPPPSQPCRLPTPTPCPLSLPAVSPPCGPTPPSCPLSPPAVSPACGTPTPTPCPLSPPAVSPPCGAPTPPSPPPCEPTSPPQSPPACATPTPVPCGAPTSPPCGGSGHTVALDCDIAAAGIQSDCTVAPGTSSLDVAVVFANDATVSTTLAAFNFNLHDTDTSRLNPLPGADANQDGNPDFNQADLTSSWNCDFPPPMTDTGADGPGRANSFLSCYTFAATPPVTVPPGGRINLAIVHYAIPANATDGSVQLALDDVSVANFDAITLVICGYGSSPCPPPAIVTIGSGANGSATPVTATATPIPTPTG